MPVVNPTSNTINRSSEHIESSSAGGIRVNYGVQLSWQSPGVDNTMYYDIGVACIGVKSAGSTVWEVTKGNYFIDNERPEGSFELLAIACAEPFYPVEFTVTQGGQIDALVNAGKIQRRFFEALPDLQRNFGGDLAKAYIQETQASLGEPEQLKKTITSDIWLSLFYAFGNEWFNNIEKGKVIIIDFPFFGYDAPLRFKGELIVGKKDNERKSQTILVNLVLDYLPAIEGRQILGGNMEIIYDTNIRGNQIRNIACHAIVNTDDGEHHIWLKGYQTSVTQRQAAIQPKEEEPKPKGWWASVFGS